MDLLYNLFKHIIKTCKPKCELNNQMYELNKWSRPKPDLNPIEWLKKRRRTQSKHADLFLYHLVGYTLYPNCFLIYMWYYASYWLIPVTVIVFMSVHKIMIDTYIGLYLTHADLQINVHMNIKSLTVNLLPVFIFYLLMCGYFCIGACDLYLYFYLLC